MIISVFSILLSIWIYLYEFQLIFIFQFPNFFIFTFLGSYDCFDFLLRKGSPLGFNSNLINDTATYLQQSYVLYKIRKTLIQNNAILKSKLAENEANNSLNMTDIELRSKIQKNEKINSGVVTSKIASKIGAYNQELDAELRIKMVKEMEDIKRRRNDLITFIKSKFI